MNEIPFFGYHALLNTWSSNHVDKYVITKHYHQLMPLSLADVRIHFSSGFRDAVKGNMANPRRRLRLCPRANKNLHIPSGYPPGNL
ncbi:hypothetical protein T05_13443 [Trichinella murrelli]|uniref:Uncharacterized protein n=1 Tax=Trichinella murrelli TaxID=144512 RepID=A0A0V0U0Y7_9BILA|nr:hypothetical protein T05_13443 [Trichinella murrelli]